MLPKRPGETPDERRGRYAWHMDVREVLLGEVIGFSYEMSGDERPIPASALVGR